MNALFISDLHLESADSDRFLRFRDILTRFRTRVDAVYILGDLVEVWVGDDDDSELADAIRGTLREQTAFVDLYLMHGNRDFLIGSEFCNFVGCSLLPDPTTIDLNGRRVLLSHGDQFCTDDTAYQSMRTILRSEEWQHNMLEQSLDSRRTFAQSLRETSRQANQLKPGNIMDVNQGAVLAAMKEYEVATLIHGHTHRPGIHVAGQDRSRYVLGDWRYAGWYLHVSTDAARLECFPIH